MAYTNTKTAQTKLIDTVQRGMSKKIMTSLHCGGDIFFYF